MTDKRFRIFAGLFMFLIVIAVIFSLYNKSSITNTKLTMMGEQVTLSNEELRPGDKLKTGYKLDIPVELVENQKTKDFSETKGKKVIQTVPSINTPVCSMQTAAMAMFASKYEDVTFIVVSQDLPFAQYDFMKEKGIDNVEFFSDYNNRAFSKDNGLLIQESNLNSRTIMIVDENNTVSYIEYAKNQEEALDLGAMIEALD